MRSRKNVPGKSAPREIAPHEKYPRKIALPPIKQEYSEASSCHGIF